LSNCFTSL